MNKLILAAAAFALFSGSALASDASGVVTRFNADTRVITLQGGASYTIPRDVALPSVRVGEKVSILFNDEGDVVRNVLAGPQMM
ncbi:uncharacterized protein DUF1344 [Aminobacter aminovorans]|uniref:Protein of uncharacterized function (DUF1344) n=1 Tax=Aminobacter aminovorans TaxID=83263 RepID=A0A380WQ43_AMIAI|nr:DUF1344 domain-containing protein [Aminobacter aminovorans]TCS25873.1 uncharacterized protein DUF1344 [Aminobacter aminovorans]SUU90462.1 Protein of uncharacterised function (DUF1344) [Aminobacter aminovorans]